jgi:hypothetical protein
MYEGQAAKIPSRHTIVTKIPISSYYVPKFVPLPLAWAKNGDQEFWKPKVHATNGLIFFLLSFGLGG